MLLSAADDAGAVVGTAGAALLLWAGVPKLGGGAPLRRAGGLAEAAAGLAVLLLPGRIAATLLAAIFLGFTLVHVRGIGADASSCDCFGEQERIDPRRAAALTALLVLLAAAAAIVGAPSLRELAAADGSALALVPALALLAAFGWRLAFSGLGLLQRIANTGGALLEGGATRQAASARAGEPDGLLERRSFLLRVAVLGSALATAPLRFLLYPGTALAAVVGPWDCKSGACAEGYTEFCCQINEGGVNECPTGTFPGGWWMCTDYTGRQLCTEQGVRFYVDCNALPGQRFPGGCRCGNDNCNNRRVACNVFRYGQCNTHIDGTTAVVCRMILCENPARVSALRCSAALATDNATCGHEAPCLEPPALELIGAGGA